MTTNAPGPAAAPTTPETPPMGLPQTIGTPETPPVVEPPQPTAEEQRIAALEAQNRQILEQNQQMMQMLMTSRTAAPAAPVAPPALQPFSLDGLPDAVAAPKDFMTGLTQRIQQREAQLGQFLTHNITTQVARGAALDGVFNRFNVQHSELAKKGALLQGAAVQEFQALQAQGIDPVNVAMQNPDSLVARIAARMNSELGVQPTTTTPGFVPNGAPMTPGSPPTQVGNNTSRVAGLAGGSGTPTAPRAPAAPKGFVEQLNEARRNSGIF